MNFWNKVSKKEKKLSIILIFLFIILFGIILFLNLSWKIFPKTMFESTASKSVRDIIKVAYDEVYNFYIDSDKIQADFDFSFKTSDDAVSTEGLSNVNLDAILQHDKEKNNGFLDLKLLTNFSSVESLNLMMSYDKNEILLMFKDILDYVIKVDISKYSNIVEEEIESSDVDYSDIIELLLIYKEVIFDNIENDMFVNDKEELNINNNNYSLNKITLNLNDDNKNKLTINILNDLVKNNKYLTLSAKLNESSVEDEKEDLEKYINNYENYYKEDDGDIFNISIYTMGIFNEVVGYSFDSLKHYSFGDSVSKFGIFKIKNNYKLVMESSDYYSEDTDVYIIEGYKKNNIINFNVKENDIVIQSGSYKRNDNGHEFVISSKDVYYDSNSEFKIIYGKNNFEIISKNNYNNSEYGINLDLNFDLLVKEIESINKIENDNVVDVNDVSDDDKELLLEKINMLIYGEKISPMQKNALKATLRNDLYKINGFIEEEYRYSFIYGSSSSDSFISICGNDGSFCVGEENKKKLNSDILEEVDLKVENYNLDSNNTYFYIKDNGSVCISLEASLNGNYGYLDDVDKIVSYCY